MKHIDIGANLTNAKYKDILPTLFKDSFENNLDSIIITGTTVNLSKNALILVEEYKDYKLYSTAGIHPIDVKDFTDTHYNQLKEILQYPKVIAVGECGLDYSRGISNRTRQLFAFEKQIQLSIEVNKPLFLHERDARDDFINIMSEYKNIIKGVVHCFTGNSETVKKYIEMGLYIGITGWICDNNKNSELIEAVKCVPLNKLMVETDCPYMNPLNTKGLNVPKNIHLIVSKLSQILDIEETKLSEILLDNTKKFFNLS